MAEARTGRDNARKRGVLSVYWLSRRIIEGTRRALRIPWRVHRRNNDWPFTAPEGTRSAHGHNPRQWKAAIGSPAKHEPVSVLRNRDDTTTCFTCARESWSAGAVEAPDPLHTPAPPPNAAPSILVGALSEGQHSPSRWHRKHKVFPSINSRRSDYRPNTCRFPGLYTYHSRARRLCNCWRSSSTSHCTREEIQSSPCS